MGLPVASFPIPPLKWELNHHLEYSPSVAYLGSTSHWNLEDKQVGHQTLQGETQAVDVHRVDQTQTALGGDDKHTIQTIHFIDEAQH